MKQKRDLKKPWHPSVVTLVMCMVFGLVTGWAIPELLVISKTDSVRPKLFLKLPFRPAIDRYVMADIDGQRVNRTGRTRIIKRIRCMPGDTIQTRGQQFFCNGRFVCTSKDGYDSARFDTIIPDNHFFLTGDSNESFDSRYFGLVSDISFCLVPLL